MFQDEWRNKEIIANLTANSASKTKATIKCKHNLYVMGL